MSGTRKEVTSRLKGSKYQPSLEVSRAMKDLERERGLADFQAGLLIGDGLIAGYSTLLPGVQSRRRLFH